MIHIIRTTAQNEHFIQLVTALDKELAVRDGADHAFYAQFNKINMLNYVVVLYDNQDPVACGAIKPYDTHNMEVKRMFVHLDFRGNGYATMVLKELEHWAVELGCKKLILETGHKQPEAIALYKKNNYVVIPNFGQYAGITDSICFEKVLY